MTEENDPQVDLSPLQRKLSNIKGETVEECEVQLTKVFRVAFDEVLQELKGAPKSRERALAITKVQEAIMWLGMDLKERGTPNPYPNSYKPENTIVDPTADSLKL